MRTETTQEIASATDLEKLDEITGELLGKVCWSAKLGYGDELTLDIGGRIARRPLSDLPKEKGEWVLKARASPWWIEPTEGSSAQALPDDTAELLRAVEGATITAVETSYPELSLIVTFDSGYTLTLTPEQDEDEEADALAYWEIFGPRASLLEVGPGARWSLVRDDPEGSKDS